MFSIVYYAGSQDRARFQDLEAEGQFDAVLDRAKTPALTVPTFMLGQVLAQDGRVLATIGPQGSVHITR